MAAVFPRMTAVGDHAVLVEFGDIVSDAVTGQVLALDAALAATGFPGFAEAVPALASLLVAFDPLCTDHGSVEATLRALLMHAGAPLQTPVTHVVPVCYDPPFGPDLGAVAGQTGLSQDAVMALHLGAPYRVGMYGFAPGYAYLSGVPAPLQLPRKTAALRGVAAGSVIIAGAQCLVTTLTMPTGWWIIGRSPVRILRDDPARLSHDDPGRAPHDEAGRAAHDEPGRALHDDPGRAFLFDVGDRVEFVRIDRAAFEASVS